MSGADFIFQFAEAISAIALPVGGGLAAYAKWRRSAERDRRAREEAARIASERAAREARDEEQGLREEIIQSYRDQINALKERTDALNVKYSDLREENERLHAYILQILTTSNRQPPQGLAGNYGQPSN